MPRALQHGSVKQLRSPSLCCDRSLSTLVSSGLQWAPLGSGTHSPAAILGFLLPHLDTSRTTTTDNGVIRQPDLVSWCGIKLHRQLAQHGAGRASSGSAAGALPAWPPPSSSSTFPSRGGDGRMVMAPPPRAGLAWCVLCLPAPARSFQVENESTFPTRSPAQRW